MKAVFLLHFAQLVDWPSGALSDTDHLINLCTIGGDPFRGALENTVEGKPIGPRTLHVKHLKDSEDPKGCGILFIAIPDAKRSSTLIAHLENNPILTVGDSISFAQEGGMIGFCLEDNKVRFDVNLGAAQLAGIKISSRLLLLAKNVIPSRG